METPRPQSQTRLPSSILYRRIAANNNEHAINPPATFTPFAEFGALVCEALGAALVCDPDGDALFPVLSVVAVVAEAEVDTTVEPELVNAADLDVDITMSLKLTLHLPLQSGLLLPWRRVSSPRLEPQDQLRWTRHRSRIQLPSFGLPMLCLSGWGQGLGCSLR